MQRGILAAVCALVLGVYAYTAHWGPFELITPKEWDNHYTLLVQGFRAGQLSLKKEVPPGLAQLADPYDPNAHAPYRDVGDMSYYKGKLYLYFGVTPAVVLFWPYVALTGHDLSQKATAVIFCLVGFLVSAGLLWALWRRYFAEVNVAVVAACTLALGLATLVPLMLSRCGIWEVPISCGYALTMLALAAIWKALHHPSQRGWWLAAGSVAYGLAVGARPSLLFGAVILLVPVAQAWRESRKVWASLLAATGPIVLIGLGLMIYNFLRFDSPFELGGHYQLAGERLLARQFFSLRYLWFNFRLYLLEPGRWSGRFPFVHDITVPPLPAGHGLVDKPFGVLTNIPLVWLALAAPLAWRSRSAEARSILGGFLAVVALLFWIGALTLGIFFYTAVRYEVEFLPALVLLAVIGIVSLERALAPTSESGQAERPVWRRAVRWGWGLLLGFSVAFSLLASAKRGAEAHYDFGAMLRQQGKMQEAMGQYEQALRLDPDCAEAHNDLGSALMVHGQVQDAIEHYEQALRVKPDSAEAHNNLGIALIGQGRLREAIGHYEQAVRLKPDSADVHYNLGVALMGQGRVQDAIGQYQQALQLKPDYAEAHNNLGIALMGQGRLQEAIGHYEQASRIQPDYVQAQCNWGSALLRVGKVQEAIGHYEQALRLNPDYAKAHNDLGAALMIQGQVQDAIGHYEQAVRVKPDFAEAHFNLGLALEQAGRVREAIQHYQQALRIKPDFVQAQNALARARAAQ